MRISGLLSASFVVPLEDSSSRAAE